MKKLIDYGVIKNPETDIEKLIEIAGNYSDEFDEQEKTEVSLDDTSKKALSTVQVVVAYLLWSSLSTSLATLFSTFVMKTLMTELDKTLLSTSV